jgi:thioredoxin 1
MTHPDLVTLTDTNLDEAALRAPVPVLIDFSATWCPPCRAMDPHVQALATQYAGKVRVGTCDMDTNTDAAIRFNVRSAPTFVMVRNGVEIGRIVGAVPRARLEAMLRKAMEE